MIILNLLKIWHLKSAREQFLAWGLFGSGESLVSAAGVFSRGAPDLLPRGFYYSTIPYSIWCVLSSVLLPTGFMGTQLLPAACQSSRDRSKNSPRPRAYRVANRKSWP